MISKIICTVCPNECEIEIDVSDNIINKLKGNKCIRGKTFVEDELIDPKRLLTTTVLINSKNIKIIPVRSNKTISKSKIRKCIEELNNIIVDIPVNVGDIIYRNILDTDVDIICCKKVLE